MADDTIPIWTNPYQEPDTVYSGHPSSRPSHNIPRPSMAPNFRKRASDGEPKFHAPDIDVSKPRPSHARPEDSRWQCGSCGFLNRASNSICGGGGRLGCKAAKPDDGPRLQSSKARQSGSKHSYSLDVGIENDEEFCVGSRVIRFLRKIWMEDNDFQQHGGKTRLRGRGLGGEHEDHTPLTLFITCYDKVAAMNALQKAQDQLQQVHIEYRAFCEKHGKPIPHLLDPYVQQHTETNHAARGHSSSSKTNADDRGDRPDSAPSVEDIEMLIEERNQARKDGDWGKADEIRNLLKENGVVLMDEKKARGRNLQGTDVTQWRYWKD